MIVSFRREVFTPRPAYRPPERTPEDTVELSQEAPATIPCPLCAGATSCGPCYGSGTLWSGALCPWCGGSKKCHRCGGAGTIPAPGFILVFTVNVRKGNILTSKF